MKIQIFPEGFAVIDDVFSTVELSHIWREINYIQDNKLFESPEDSGTAINARTGENLKKNSAVFLDDLAQENKVTHIIPIISKLFRAPIPNALEKIHPFFSVYKKLNYSTNLLSYYETGGYYRPHTDNSVFTILTWLYKEPKSWTGGNLILNDFDAIIEVRNNRSLIIPGSYSHQVDPVKLTTNNPGMGRYCISQFGYVKPVA